MGERVHGDTGEPTKIRARLARADARADDGPDTEALPDELVEADAASDDVATRRGSRQPDRLKYLGLDQRQMHAGLIGVVRPSADTRVVAVTCQSPTRNRACTYHEHRRRRRCVSDKDLLDETDGKIMLDHRRM